MALAVFLALAIVGVIGQRLDEPRPGDAPLWREHDALPVRPTRVLRLTTRIERLAADGWHVAVATGGSSDALVVTWDTRSGAFERFDPFVPSSGGEELRELAMVSNRPAWIFSDWEPRSFIVSTLVVSGQPVRQANVMAGEDLASLHGEGDLLVYNTWTPDVTGALEPKLWRLIGETERLVRSGPNAARAVAVDDARVLLERPDGDLEVVSADGASAGVVDPALALANAKLDGLTVFGETDAGIQGYDVSSGHRTSIVPTGVSNAHPRLHDVEAGMVVYAVGDAVHVVRVPETSELVIKPSAAHASVRAQLEEVGLYYAYNRRHDGEGRVVFVPTSRLEQAFDRLARSARE